MRCRPGGPSCSTKAVAVPSSARAYVSSVSCDGFGCPTVLGCRRPRVVVCKAPERLKVSWVEDMLPRPFQVCPKVYGRPPDWLARRPGSLLADLEIVEDALQPRDVVCVALTGGSGTGGAAFRTACQPANCETSTRSHSTLQVRRTLPRESLHKSTKSRRRIRAQNHSAPSPVVAVVTHLPEHASIGVLKVPLRQDVSGASLLHLGDKARYPHYFGDGLDRQTAAEPLAPC